MNINQANAESNSGARTCSAKYLFLDVVKFTHNRNVEAQSDIVDVLNGLVLDAMNKYRINGDDTRIFIPTGDGLCIALMNTEGKYSFDIHMLIALDLLMSLDSYNSNQCDEMRKFEIRIGINANEDNLIKDINGKDNLAGVGISLASRIMDKADGGQILVGDAVFDRLQQREQYMGQFQSFVAKDKHGKGFRLHQYIQRDCLGLNIDTPHALSKSEPVKLTREMGYYFAHAIKNRAFISRTRKEFTSNEFALQILLHLLARDSSAREDSSDFRDPQLLTWKAGEASFEEQYRFYQTIDHQLLIAFWYQIKERIESARYDDFFESAGLAYLFINSKGTRKLKEQFPDIWEEFDLDNS